MEPEEQRERGQGEVVVAVTQVAHGIDTDGGDDDPADEVTLRREAHGYSPVSRRGQGAGQCGQQASALLPRSLRRRRRACTRRQPTPVVLPKQGVTPKRGRSEPTPRLLLDDALAPDIRPGTPTPSTSSPYLADSWVVFIHFRSEVNL